MGQHADDTLIVALDDQIAFEDYMSGDLSEEEAYERGLITETGIFQNPDTFEDVIRALNIQAQSHRKLAEKQRSQYYHARRKIALKRKRL